jgi:hypothetical protein
MIKDFIISKIDINDFQIFFNDNEISSYKKAIMTMLNYIKSYENKEMKIKKNSNKKQTTSDILELVYHDIILRRRGTHHIEAYETAANLVQQGIMFLPDNLTDKFELEMNLEPIAFDALGQYFENKRDDKNNILEDPILGLCYDELKKGYEGSGYIWEDCFCRFLMLNMHPKLSERQSIKHSSIFKKFVEKDETLQYYTFEGLYIIDEDFSEQNFKDYLLSNDAQSVYYPDNFVGPDNTLKIIKMSFKECIQINKKLSHEEYIKLPNIRIVIIQEKFLTTGKSLKGWELHAVDTCNLSKCYTGKKMESKYRDTFENEFIETNEGKELIDWSIGILCVVGDVPMKLDKETTYVDENNSEHQLFGCITPLSFNFEGELQELLIKTCKLSDKSLKIHIKELFESFY